ncbi:MAG: hypothetical protein U0869_11915 [Chloroflexota bacterium]
MRRTRALLAAGLLTLGVAGGALAADPASPGPAGAATAGLRSSLGHAPATPDVWGPIVSWVDLRAVEAARPGALQPATLAEALAALQSDDPAARLWLQAMMGIAGGSSDLMADLMGSGPEWPATVGFDFTQIDRELAFGQPPADGLVLEGRFDPAAIGAALSARGFASHDEAGTTWWCSADGCDQGLQVDFKGRDPNDPFGGRLGRKQPLAVSADALLSSASDVTVGAMAAASAGTAPSLATDPFVAATLDALDAASPDARLIQAMFVPGTELLLDPLAVLGTSASPEDIRAILERLSDGFEPIPPAALLLIADTATADEQVVQVVLSYATLADAQAAAEVLPKRLATMSSFVTDRTWADLLADRGAAPATATAMPVGDGAGAAVVTLRAPLAASEPDADGKLQASSLLYRLFVNAVYQRDLAWLTPTLPAVP